MKPLPNGVCNAQTLKCPQKRAKSYHEYSKSFFVAKPRPNYMMGIDTEHVKILESRFWL